MKVNMIVVGESDLCDDVKALWKAELDGKTAATVRAPDEVSYLDQAEGRLANDRDTADLTVVIVDQHARQNRRERGEADLATMAQRLATLITRHQRARVILCLYEEQLRAAQLMDLQGPHLALVSASDLATMRQYLLRRIREAISTVPDPNPRGADAFEAIAEFRFHVSDPELRLHYFVGEMPMPPSRIPIRGDVALMQRFLETSNEVDTIARLEPSEETRRKLIEALKTLDRIGSELVVDDALVKEYAKLSSANLASRVRFRITTSAERYPCLFEAIRIGAEPRPLVVEHPTYRSVCFGEEDARLRHESSGDNPVNILVVVANVPGGAPITVVSEDGEQPVSFRSLPFVEEEAKLFGRLKSAFDDDVPFERADGTPTGKVRVAIGNVDVLRYEADKPLLSHRLKTALAERQYDILHFIGHAYGHRLPTGDIDTRLVLPTGDPMAAEALTLFQLTTWLKAASVQFVYLSCCSGIPSKGGAGLNLTSAPVAQLFRSIPVVLGFRWDVPDGRAFDFAEDFYMELFTCGCGFDEALQRARRNVFEPHAGSDPMWIAPVILLH